VYIGLLLRPVNCCTIDRSWHLIAFLCWRAVKQSINQSNGLYMIKHDRTERCISLAINSYIAFWASFLHPRGWHKFITVLLCWRAFKHHYTNQSINQSTNQSIRPTLKLVSIGPISITWNFREKLDFQLSRKLCCDVFRININFHWRSCSVRA